MDFTLLRLGGHRVQGIVLAAVLAAAACGSDDDAEQGGAAKGGRSGGVGGAGSAGRSSGGTAGKAAAGRSGEAGRGEAEAGAAGSVDAGAGGGGAGDETSQGGAGGEAEVARFGVELEPVEISLPRGASAWITVTTERAPGFDEPISVSFGDLPAGWASEVLMLPAGVESGVLAVHSTAAASEEEIELTARGSSGGSVVTATLDVNMIEPEGSSQEKIRAALIAESIDYPTSLLYRAYAFWADGRLPEELVGAGSEEEDNGLFEEIRLRASEFSTAEQAALRPFLVRPASPESYWNHESAPKLRRAGDPLLAIAPGSALASCPPESAEVGAWISRRGTDAVRVWAACTGNPATDAESERLIDQTLGALHKIYAPMTGSMTVPIEDEEGPDTAIDFYLVDGNAVTRRGASFRPAGLGSTFSDFPELGNGASAFVVLPRSLLYTSRFHTTLIHEFFHVLEKAYNHKYGYRELTASNVYVAHWFPEAAAVWASAHFDRTLAPWDGGRGAYLDAHRRFQQRFQTSKLALNAREPVAQTYAAYIWPYFVEMETQSASFMTQIWEGLIGVSSWDAADDAISAVYPFADHFKDFALKNLNVSFTPGDPLPESERYVSLDPGQFPDGVGPEILQAELVAEEEFRQALPIANLGARYVQFGARAGIRKVEFDFSGLQPADAIDVQALVETNDGWLSEPLDLSGESRAVFCFDEGPTTATRRGSFLNVLFVISNHAMRPDSAASGELVVKPEENPCALVWQGTVSMSYSGEAELGTVTISSSTPVTFEFDDTAPASPFSTLYRLKSGSYVYDWLGNYTERTPACQTRERGSGTMVPGGFMSGTSGATSAQLEFLYVTTPGTYSGSGLTLTDLRGRSDCNDQNIVSEYDSIGSFSWWQMPPGGLTIPEDGATLTGSHEVDDGLGGTYEFVWTLHKMVE
jgi:hypothetical protein